MCKNYLGDIRRIKLDIRLHLTKRISRIEIETQVKGESKPYCVAILLIRYTTFKENRHILFTVVKYVVSIVKYI